MSTEKDVVDEYGDDNACDAVTELDSREIVGGSVSNVVSDSSETSGTEVARFTTLPHKIFSSDKSESHSGHLKLERSKTEPPTHNSQFAQEAANISDDSDSEQQKLKLLKRIATVRDNGTVEFEIPGDEESRVLGVESQSVCNEVEDVPLDELELHYIPPIQIVMLIVGTRGDVQPFIAIGKRLQEYGHRVRLATHANFKEFVLTAGLEFYPLGGDPKVLAGYMVKNKGFLPSAPSEIPVQRNQLKDIISSLLPACEEPDMDTGVPFKPDAIIANPPAYGHTHVAEALKIPIHIFFTMPWTPTSEFPHPLSRIKQPAGYRLSYQIVDSLIWLGIRDMINDTRKRKLKLRPVTYLSSSQVSVLDIPHGYIWSPHLVSKPKDWGPKVDVVGFCFLDLASGYEPPESLVNWLKDGQKPIYIGFGSLPVQEPEKMTQIIVEALERTGQRGIINKGWGGLGNLAEPKDFVYLLDNCPHDWLFLQCSAVVHHGGAGTTAAGLKAACPTTIVPFFGDQPFWGERVHARGVGPPPIPIDEFSLPKLVEAIEFMLDPKVKERAVELAKAMENEDGVTGAVKAFFKHLPRNNEPDLDETPARRSLFSLRRCLGFC
ncbi:sterol 3-beta-glucosyltransferase UGT80A2-like isoform X1 [Solanum stenotomum]|uniref:sterol 3-beta-glucosyltransferase UGT80A2-like isoform X1 n=1 Tax=Solanum stenotomum TaxID=172797 RepID=UPI0020D1B3BA|nr:sterol 3-beta-glucosyltransferase UGT80A2-like isoform X1 [Solanum stenotomum]